MATKLRAKEPEKHEPSKPKILLYGAPGVGKTWFSLDFPKAYYIDPEGGAARSHYMEKLKKSGGMVMGPEEGALDFEVVIGQIQALGTEKHAFKTVIIDSISKLFNTAVAQEAERLGAKDAFGASKKPAVAFMRRMVNWINRVDMNVVLVSHEKEEWGMDNKGERTAIGKTFDCWDKLGYELDLVLQVVKQGASRYGIVKKSRLTGFPDNDRFDFDYKTFSERYGKDVIEKEVEAIQLATSEQVTEIERLVGILRPTEEDVQKIWNKAQATGWTELTSEQASKVIESYTKKISKPQA